MENEQKHEAEKSLYIGGPSQIINYNIYTICGIIFLLAIIAPSLWDSILVHVHFFAKKKHIYVIISKALFFLPIVWSFYAWIKIHSHKYEITTERFIETTGIFSRKTNEMELFRVRDIVFLEPFGLRMMGCGNIVIESTDKSNPVVVLRSIHNPKPVVELLRANISIMRTKKNIREIQMTM